MSWANTGVWFRSHVHVGCDNKGQQRLLREAAGGGGERAAGGSPGDLRPRCGDVPRLTVGSWGVRGAAGAAWRAGVAVGGLRPHPCQSVAQGVTRSSLWNHGVPRSELESPFPIPLSTKPLPSTLRASVPEAAALQPAGRGRLNLCQPPKATTRYNTGSDTGTGGLGTAPTLGLGA